MLPDKDDAKIFETLMRIRRKDPQIYQSDVFFFGKEGDAAQQQEAAAEDTGDDAGPQKRSKKMFLKDVLAKQVWGKDWAWCLCRHAEGTSHAGSSINKRGCFKTNILTAVSGHHSSHLTIVNLLPVDKMFTHVVMFIHST